MIHGIVKQGKFYPNDPIYFKHCFDKFEGLECQFPEPIKKSKPRSNRQNKYYQFIIKLIGDDLGYEKYEFEQLKIEFRSMFLSENKTDKYGNEHLYVKSTTQLSTLEMENYLEEIRRFASIKLNLIVPLPNEDLNYDTH
jgi:hypothetical protein